MRNKFIFVTVFTMAIVLLASLVVSALDRRDSDVIGYNVLKERMFKATVASKGHISEDLMYFSIRFANAVMEVQIGPKEFVDRSGFTLNMGETVTVIGMPALMNGRPVILARKISAMNAVLVVRDQVGLPLWERNRPTLMDPERRIRFHEECEVNEVNLEALLGAVES
jgi:ABC-type uncharacterized transport system permease subunit